MRGHYLTRYLVVDAVMILGSTPQGEKNDIMRRLRDMASGRSESNEIKLCYITVGDHSSLRPSNRLPLAREARTEQRLFLRPA